VDFSVIREQGFTRTTGWDVIFPEEYEWSQRKLPAEPFQASPFNGKLEGAAWEHFIDLCNLAGMDIWLNVPISASDDYVLNLAGLVRERLDTALNIYVENDNEVWNSAPAFVGTYNYNQDEATALGITAEENIARRAVELSSLFAQVFGQDQINKRIRVILASHAPMLKWWVLPMLQYIQNTYGPPKNYIYGISRQTYFSTDEASGNMTSDAIINKLYENITYQLEDDPVNDAGRVDWIRVANEWELPGGATSYEGGPHTPSGGGEENLANQIQMHRSERMIDLLRYNIVNNWFDLGGGIALHFTLVSGYNRYGCWGLTDDLKDPDRNYKMEALRDLSTVTGLNDAQVESPPIKIFPNPAINEITVLTDLAGIYQVTIHPVSGSLILFTGVTEKNRPLNISMLRNGLYVIQVEVGGKRLAQKLIVSR
jgi:hypothetical protein